MAPLTRRVLKDLGALVLARHAAVQALALSLASLETDCKFLVFGCKGLISLG